jgi:predicted DCC family thiol-disulfide oxidoreductase YuxK
MRWDAVATPDLTQDLILFDGDCVLCSRSARFVHERDKAGRFAFVALQSPFGRALATRFGIDAENPQTNLAVVGGQAFFKSDAALAVAGALGRRTWVGLARALPKPLRDWAYDRIARNRYTLFGRRARCWVADPDFRARIIEQAP